MRYDLADKFSVKKRRASRRTNRQLDFKTCRRVLTLAAMFGKPKGGQPTRHLFVGNCGPSVGVDQELVTQIFGQYGTATVTVPEQKQNPHSAFVFVSYANVEEATAALSALNDNPCARAHGRRFVIKHADLKKDQVVPPGVLFNRA